MAKPNVKKKISAKTATRNTTAQLRKVLTRQTKVTLVDLLMDIACADRKIMRKLEARFDVNKTVANLITSTRQAISDATYFDARKINYNFDYDCQAYDTVRKNLKKLAKLGLLKDAMVLTLELMRKGSYQVEMSDEGLMTDDIEECLQVVFVELRKADLPARKIIKYCDALTNEDCIKCICYEDIVELRNSKQGNPKILNKE